MRDEPVNAPSFVDQKPYDPFPKKMKKKEKRETPKVDPMVKYKAEDTDIFDLVKDQLMSQGYGEKDAMQMMVNMDEGKLMDYAKGAFKHHNAVADATGQAIKRKASRTLANRSAAARDIPLGGRMTREENESLASRYAQVYEGMHREADTGKVVDKAEVGKTYHPNQPKKKTSVTKKPDAFGGRFQKEETAFDVILEYLMDRGFPQEDALQLMATMDEDKRTQILGEASEKAKKEAKHDEKLAKKDEEEAQYDTNKGKGKRAKELDDDAKQDDADAAEDMKSEEVSWDRYGRPKSKEGKAKAARAQAEMRVKDRQAGRRPYGSRTGYAKKSWDE